MIIHYCEVKCGKPCLQPRHTFWDSMANNTSYMFLADQITPRPTKEEDNTSCRDRVRLLTSKNLKKVKSYQKLPELVLLKNETSLNQIKAQMTI